MSFELFREQIIPASAAGLTTEELRRYLGVGRNNVTSIAHRFGIDNLHGVYPERVVWRQLFGLAPDDETAQAALREPLADINWLSSATRVPPSSIRDHLRSGRWKYDRGIQLGDDKAARVPRLRRWIPAVIRNRVCGVALPSFSCLPPFSVSSGEVDLCFPHPGMPPAPQAEHTDH